MLYDQPAAVIRAVFDHPRSRSRFDEVVDAMGVDRRVADAARRRLVDGTVGALVVSGPQASGKDTVGPAVMVSLGLNDHVRVGIADGLKREMSTLLTLLAGHGDRRAAAADAAAALDVTVGHATVLVDLLWDATRDPSVRLDGWTRTGEVRRALQYLGHEARGESDPLRYVRIAVPTILAALADGTSVYMGDGRFPREAGPCGDLGMFLVRLHVDADVKTARLLARDGLIADPAALHHEGEHALDGWDGVDLRVDNSHAPRGEVVAAVAGAFALHRARLSTDLR